MAAMKKPSDGSGRFPLPEERTFDQIDWGNDGVLLTIEEVTNLCKDLKHKVPEMAMKKFFFTYKQVLVVVSTRRTRRQRSKGVLAREEEEEEEEEDNNDWRL